MFGACGFCGLLFGLALLSGNIFMEFSGGGLSNTVEALPGALFTFGFSLPGFHYSFHPAPAVFLCFMLHPLVRQPLFQLFARRYRFTLRIRYPHHKRLSADRCLVDLCLVQNIPFHLYGLCMQFRTTSLNRLRLLQELRQFRYMLKPIGSNGRVQNRVHVINIEKLIIMSFFIFKASSRLSCTGLGSFEHLLHT